MYFGSESSRTRPPKPITVPLISKIGNISLPLKRSNRRPELPFITRPLASIASSLMPWDLRCS